MDQILSNYGYCSRKEARVWIKGKRVTLKDGTPVSSFSDKYDPAELLIDNEPIPYINGFVAVLNKPAGYICTHSGAEGANVFSLLPDWMMQRDPLPTTVGRLDKDTTGILLITDVHPLVHNMISPKKHVKKIYEVTLDKPLQNDIVDIFKSGTLLLDEDPKPCLPAECIITSETTCSLTLEEGRYHQVKRMFAVCGYEVVKLHRTRFGEYTLDDLKDGELKIFPYEE